MPQHPRNLDARIVFLDVVETVFSLAPLEEKMTALNLPEGTDRVFFAQLLRDAFALSASGVFHTFPEIARGTLTVLLHSIGHEADETTLKDILAAFSQLPAHEDVRPALEKLKPFDCQAVLLTNGSRANTEKLVRDNDLEQLVDDIVSVDDFQIWKPQTALYQQAAREYSCAPANALLVAAHAWDVHGALRAGFHGVWIQRQDSIYHPLMGNPDHQVASLVDAVDLAVKQLKCTGKA
ncbi:haloacid dehalogenase type II [Chromatocurvus halotolerans]|uniref:(S)-2-haloacid dehalogenase n=1 Tax=Chromatocurvus halotolerans TaxID=1132028 RepID=A0A4R2KVC4_9GAMM|nr:haloacid dehalogenase type II [Chromatocurvus halotolerans]TCO77884.1 2-haloacid dehalogenase [Chromatocurvus halotolerans]